MSHDDLGTRIAGSIHDHVDRLPAGHVSVRDVQQRVGRIRRTRRLAMAAASVAVAAVVVPTVMFMSSPGGDRAPGPVASSTPSPTATGPADVTLPADPQVGDAPAIDWGDTQRLVLSDGTAPLVDRAPHQQFVRVGSRVLALRSGGEGTLLDVYDGDSRPETRTISGDVVVSPGGDTAAWAEPDGSVWTAWDGGMLELDTQSAGASAAAVFGDGSCRLSEGDGCTVYLNTADGPPRFVASDGQAGIVTPETIKLNDMSGYLAATQTAYDQGRACSTVFDVPQAKVMWEGCDYALLRFSPDGRHLTATTSDSDGIGPTSVTVLRATTGDPVVTYRVDNGFIGAQAWEDDGHLLLVRYSYATSGWDIVRVDLSGTVWRAAPVVDAAEDERPYTLGGNR